MGHETGTGRPVRLWTPPVYRRDHDRLVRGMDVLIVVLGGGCLAEKTTGRGVVAMDLFRRLPGSVLTALPGDDEEEVSDEVQKYP